MCRESDGIISLTFGDLDRSDQGHLLNLTLYSPYGADASLNKLLHLLKIPVSVRDSAIVTIEHL